MALSSFVALYIRDRLMAAEKEIYDVIDDRRNTSGADYRKKNLKNGEWKPFFCLKKRIT